MPALFNIGANFLLGTAMAIVSQSVGDQRREVLSWPFMLLLGFQALIMTPIATFLFRFYPQWSMLYWFDPQIYPAVMRSVGFLSGVAVLLNFAAATGGFFLARFAILAHLRWLLLGSNLVVGIGMVCLCWLFGKQILFVGDHDSFLQGQAELIFAGLPGWAGLAMYACGALLVVGLHRRLRGQ